MTVGQLLVVRTSGFERDEDRLYPDRELDWAALTEAITRYQVGGVLIFGGNVSETPRKIARLQALSQIPLLICADLEEGAGQHFQGATRLPPAMALAQVGEEACFEAGRITALEARALGVNWVLAPVADVNANPRNPVINVRAFGEDGAGVTAYSLA
ncbi:glycoside hydrolase family 3 N-terminal domain-containing protein, partial [Candidatus Cyanaurora vandensis]